METRKLGWTDLELTRIGLGTWSMGGSKQVYGWGPQDDKPRFRQEFGQRLGS